MSHGGADAVNHRVDEDSSLLESDEEVPVHVGVPLGTTGIPVSDYWKSMGLYTVVWIILGWIVAAGAETGRVMIDLGPALWGFSSGLVLAALELVVSVKSSLLLGMEDKAIDFYPSHAKPLAQPMRGPFEALARRADIIATTCFNVAACVITWAVYITTSSIGGGARQLQWNILAFSVALLAGGTATATGNIPAFERSLFARQRALIFAISLAVAAVMHAKRT